MVFYILIKDSVMKKVIRVQTNNQLHWVGDGFPVRSIFSYHEFGAQMSPFLLMDYAGPTSFTPSSKQRGVGEHPHRGFETVTLVYAGEVAHRDSAGGGGTIKTGEVQWMTAGSGLVHEELHSKEFSKHGGMMEMVQLWVNLPKKHKLTSPRYQTITNQQLPEMNFPNINTTVRIIAGECNHVIGPAKTFSPINLWDIRMLANTESSFSVPTGHTASLFVLSGNVELNGGKNLEAGEMAIMEREGSNFSIKAMKDAKVLFLGGEAINEPIVGYGPFVMNTREEIQQAVSDYQNGKMGHLS